MSASRQSSRQHRVMMADSVKTSPNTETTPDGEELVERVDVGRDPRHQPADRIAVVERHVEPLQMRVNLHAQVEHDALPRHLQRQSSARTRARTRRSAWPRRATAIERNAVDVPRRDVDVDDLRGQPGRHELQRRRPRESTTSATRTARQCGRRYMQQPAHQPRVVRFAENVFFVHVVVSRRSTAQLAASSSSSSCCRCNSAYKPAVRDERLVRALLDDAAVVEDEI